MAALITLEPQDPGEAPLGLLGCSIARHQLDFALAAGCGTIMLLGRGISAQAVALRQAAEAAGARVHIVAGSHVLANVVEPHMRLLVLQPGVVPGHELLAQLPEIAGGGLLVLPSGAGADAGFERIDLARAWSGVLVAPASLLDQLRQLPEDAEATAALLRLAVQARLREVPLGEAALDHAAIAIARTPAKAESVERSWLLRRLAALETRSPSQYLARLVLGRGARAMLARRGWDRALLASAVVLNIGAVAGAAYGLAGAALLAVALSVPLLETALGLRRLRAPLAAGRDRADWLRIVPDLAIAGIGFLSIAGIRLHRIGPPLTLLAALNIDPPGEPRILAILRDRAVIALALASLAQAVSLETAYVAVSLLILAALVTLRLPRKRITAN